MRWIDPSSGSKYGFPKPFDPAPGQAIDDWLLGNGYPRLRLTSGRAGTCLHRLGRNRNGSGSPSRGKNPLRVARHGR